MAAPVLSLGIGPRERRWLLAFLILGSAYFALLLIQWAFTFFAGFSQVILILFLAWLLAFVMSPVARFIDDRLPVNWSLAVVIAYTLALIAKVSDPTWVHVAPSGERYAAIVSPRRSSFTH